MLAFLIRNLNDIIYLILLLLSVAIGPYYRTIQSVQLKKWLGTGLGMLLIIAVSGYNALHPFVSIAMGLATIKIATVKYCHVASFFLMFGYLFFFRLADKFGLPPPSGQTNIIEMIIVLRVVGVAFEINGSWLAMKKSDEKEVAKDKDDEFTELINPSLVDLFHYSFNYIGLLTGPYSRYRTFNDYFNLPFYKHVNCTAATINTLKCVPIYITLYLILSSYWPFEYVLTDDHNSRSFFYRMMYPWMTFTTFRLRIYSGMILAECVCTAAGYGVYPKFGENKTGHGPTVGYSKIKAIKDAHAKDIECDFNTIVSMDVWGCETVVTLRSSMKVWNKAVQYWISFCVYKRLPIKPLKIHAALFVSVIWHGIQPGYFFCIYFCPFYLMAEDIFYKLYYKNATGLQRKVVGFVMWFLRSHSESYQHVAFLLLTFERLWSYYTSMHHYWYGCLVVLLILAYTAKAIHGGRKEGRTERDGSKKEL